jgi:hypothetical protein
MTYGNGFWVAGSDASGLTKVSTDTITWTTVSKSGINTPVQIVYANNIFVGSGLPRLLRGDIKYTYTGLNDIISS